MPDDRAVGDLFGHSVSLVNTDGDEYQTIIGAWGYNYHSGKAYIYSRSSLSVWASAEIPNFWGGANDHYAFSVCFYDAGERALIGAPGYNEWGELGGLAYWVEYDAELNDVVGAGTAHYSWNAGNQLGYSVDCGTITSASGSPGDDDGLVIVDGIVTPTTTLRPSTSTSNFGQSVAVSEDDQRVLAGADNMAFLYEYNSDLTDFVEEEILTPSDGAAASGFGQSVDIFGDWIVVGAPLNDDVGTDSGSVYVFRLLGDSSWVEQANLMASDGSPQDYFGQAVSLDGDILVVGAYGDDDRGTDAGAGYLFRYDSDSESWEETGKFTDVTGGDDHGHLGWDVSVAGEYALIGSPGFDSSRGAVLSLCVNRD